MRECTCWGTCRGAAGLGSGWRCVLEIDRERYGLKPHAYVYDTTGTCNVCDRKYDDPIHIKKPENQ